MTSILSRTLRSINPHLLTSPASYFATRSAYTWIPKDLPKFRDGFNDIPELENANEMVQKIFALDQASNTELRKVIRTMNAEKYETDLEKNIANNTAHIRMMIEHFKRDRQKNKQSKVFIIWCIDQRKKRLKRLKELDLEKYERIIEELEIPPLQSGLDPHNRYKFRKYKINVPLKKRREIDDFEHDRVY